MEPIYSVIIILLCIALIMICGGVIAVRILKDQPWRNYLTPNTIWATSTEDQRNGFEYYRNQVRLSAYHRNLQIHIEKMPLSDFLLTHPAPLRQAD